MISNIYGKMVANGEWRDYGISILKEVSIFSIYKRYSEYPIYMVQKKPLLAKKQGMYSIVAMDGRILKRGKDLSTVLRVFRPKTLKL